MGYVKVFSISIGKQLLEIGLFMLLTILVVGSLKTRTGFVVVQAAQENPEKTRSEITLPALEDDATLFFVSTDIPSLLAAQVKKSNAPTNLLPEVTSTKRLRSWVEESTQKGEQEDKKPSQFGHDGHIAVDKLFPSPDGQQIAIQVYMGSVPVVWALELQDRESPTLKPFTTQTQGIGFFLGWHPNGQHALVKMLDIESTDPGLWLVDTNDGTHQHLEIPELVAAEGLMAAAISPDGSKIAYSITKGMGFGSQIWLTDINGTNQTLIREDKFTVSSSLSWSDDGSQIAFTNLVDSPVPFAAAGLWSMNSDGTNQQFLTTMDGGHGQTPLWSKDGQKLFFVARDNLDDVNADYESEALVSSIRSIDVNTHEKSVLVPANGARQIDLSLTPDGNLLFVSNRQGTEISEGQNRTIDSSISTNQIYLPIISGNFGNLRGILEVWTVSPRGELQRLSADGEAKRHPVLVPYIDQS